MKKKIYIPGKETWPLAYSFDLPRFIFCEKGKLITRMGKKVLVKKSGMAKIDYYNLSLARQGLIFPHRMESPFYLYLVWVTYPKMLNKKKDGGIIVLGVAWDFIRRENLTLELKTEKKIFFDFSDSDFEPNSQYLYFSKISKGFFIVNGYLEKNTEEVITEENYHFKKKAKIEIKLIKLNDLIKYSQNPHLNLSNSIKLVLSHSLEKNCSALNPEGVEYKKMTDSLRYKLADPDTASFFRIKTKMKKISNLRIDDKFTINPHDVSRLITIVNAFNKISEKKILMDLEKENPFVDFDHVVKIEFSLVFNRTVYNDMYILFFKGSDEGNFEWINLSDLMNDFEFYVDLLERKM